MLLLIVICILHLSILHGFPFISNQNTFSSQNKIPYLNSNKFGMIIETKTIYQQRFYKERKNIYNKSNLNLEVYRKDNEDDDLYYKYLNENNDTMMRYDECLFENQNDTQTINFVGAGTLGDIMSTSSNQPKHLNRTKNLPFSNNQTMNLFTSNDIQIKTNINDRMLLKTKTTKSTISKTIDGDASSLESGLVTTTGGTIRAKYSTKMNGHITPLERIALTANGNLQRIFSSFYDAPVHVTVDKCQLRIPNTNSHYTNFTTYKDSMNTDTTIPSHTTNNNHQMNNTIPSSNYDPCAYYHRSSIPAIWDRAVHLSVHGQKFCTAYSQINVYSQECIDLVCSGKVGIGQIFRYLDKLPTFHLLDAGRLDHANADGGMWREYLLSCDELECHIREEFTSNAWHITPNE